MDNDRSSGNELILNPGEYAFLQDKTSGNVQTNVGPFVVTQTGQVRPISFKGGIFHETSLTSAVQQCVSAVKGEYLILSNPTVDDSGLKHPEKKNPNPVVPDLLYGETIVVPGPCQFALWPEQEAEVVEGHNLRDDQFLVVRVYDEEAAIANWSDAVVKTIDTGDGEESVAVADAGELGLTIGKLLVIKGVSFYIPPTGVEVIEENDSFVRDALTLEMGEYAILVDQSGNKRYERGPQIVFPEPTEEFYKENDSIKFKPIELTPTQGIHIKINCDYTDQAWPTGSSTEIREFDEGEEVFITGETHPIYYPQEEHSIVRYGDQLVHFATAVSAGQARYIMNKETGIITTREGPDMILLNPINEVFVKRVLSDAESLLMYPGNQDSLAYNQSLRAFQLKRGTEKEVLTNASLRADYEDFGGDQIRSLRSCSAAAPAAIPDQIQRKTSYTKPHSVTLDDRFDGAPTLKIWTGFAVLLTRADGSRRVEVGPQVVVLDFDETVSPLHLSTSKPKTTDNLLTTGFLEVKNNKVSDIVAVETLDGVTIQLKLSYRVSFDGDKTKWFDVDNYVKFLCDHVRSRLKGTARRFNVREFYNDTVAIVRDNILGEKVDNKARTGLPFEENGMTIMDVELLGVAITDEDIEELLVAQQQAVVTNQIEIDRATQQLEVETATQQLDVARLTLRDELRQERHTLALAEFADQVQLTNKQATDSLQRMVESVVLVIEQEKGKLVQHEADLARRESLQGLQIALSTDETTNIVTRFKAAEGDLSAAILQLGDETVLAKVAEAMGPMRLIGGASITDALAGLIGTPGNRNDLFDRLSGAFGDNGTKVPASV